VWDSPNSAGVVIDALRCAKLAKNHGIGGALLGPSAYFMKSPAIQYTDEQARLMTEDFIREHGYQGRGAHEQQAAKSNGHATAEAVAVGDLPQAE
jgi:myo-inositol-1-phosphate synthase